MPALVGTPQRRREDPPLLAGEARYVDDLYAPWALHIHLVRSPYAHARIRSVSSSEASARPGVVAVLGGADLQPDWAGPLPCAVQFPDLKVPQHWPVAVDVARYAGDAVAVVVAASRAAARDAAEAVVVDYEELPAAVDLSDAAEDRAIVHEGFGTNTAYVAAQAPDDAAVAAAFASAAHVVKERFVQQRLIASAIEPRGVLVQPSVMSGEYTVYSSTQVPHILKVMLSLTTGIPEHKIRVVAPSVGGGFGSKLNVYSEEVLALALARKLRRAVRWTEERSENAQATVQGRGQIQEIELAADADGRVKAVRVNLIADMGAYFQLLTPFVPLAGGALYAGVYDVPAYHLTCTGVFTNKTPTDAYRGAGRPEATYAIERAMDSLARTTGLDPAEIRRRNFIPTASFPFTSPLGLVYDSGDYAPNQAKALEIAGYESLRADQARRRAAGSTKHLGVGLSTYVEMCGLAPSRVMAAIGLGAGGWESATVRVLPTGKVQVVTGTSPHGQGHETSWSMIVADRLGVPPEDIDVVHSDTAVAPLGLDTYGSRSVAVGGTAVFVATDRVIDKARSIAAHLLEASEEDLEYENGAFAVRGSPDKAMPIQLIAFEAFLNHRLPDGMEPNLEASVSWDPPNFTFPFGTHVAVVEVDEETGRVTLQRYIAVDDCGNQINPMIVEGQVHGGIVQGVGQALFEEAVYDDAGNLLTTTFADYLVPSAAEVPSFTLGSTVTPSPSNPMGVKGVGEAGTIGSTPAVINAIVDALSPLGVKDVQMPASPERVWRAIQGARGTDRERSERSPGSQGARGTDRERSERSPGSQEARGR